MKLPFNHIRPLLQTGTSSSSRIFSYIGLGIGVLLLLCSIQMYINIQQMLRGNVVRKDGFDFISITKTITNETMGQMEKNLFHKNEIDELQNKQFVEGVSPLLANQFRVQLSAGAIIPFSTDLPLDHLLNLWQALNRQIVLVVEKIPSEKLNYPVDPQYDNKEMKTLGWIIADYVAHMEHHLKQLSLPLSS